MLLYNERTSGRLTVIIMFIRTFILTVYKLKNAAYISGIFTNVSKKLIYIINS